MSRRLTRRRVLPLAVLVLLLLSLAVAVGAATTPSNRDRDRDGLADARESELGANPTVADTDSDGLTDGKEVDTYRTDPLAVDTDGDGLGDAEEMDRGTNPRNPDTDGDGLEDGEEAATDDRSATHADAGQVARTVGRLRNLPTRRPFVLLGAVVLGVALAGVGVVRAVGWYREYTSPMVVLIDDADLDDEES